MKKVLSIFMAIAMFVTMFSFSTVAFAEEIAEPEAKPALNKFLGTAAVQNFGLKYDRKQGVIADDTQGGTSKPWNLNVFDPDTVIENKQISAVYPTVGTTLIDKVNGYAASGEYSSININFTASAENAVLFYGLKGTEETPIVLLTTSSSVDNKTFNSKTEAPAISLIDCENVIIKNIAVSSLSNGIFVEGCSDVTIENVVFSEVGFTDYAKPNVDEAGNETFSEMETADLSAKGSSVFVGANCDGVTVSACSFTNCRAGVVADSSLLNEGDVASTGVAVLDCAFEKMTDVAVYVDATADVVVSGGSVTGSGIIVKAANYDSSVSAANFYANNAQNITIEKVYSTDNTAFINAVNTTGRVRYNVSVRDGSSSVAAAELLIYNNTFVDASTLDLTAKASNNIFWMLMGEKVAVSEGDNNCYYWTSKGDSGSIRKNPRFAYAFDGTVEGTTVRDNYIIAASSPCLGSGVKVEDDMGATDFYGNAAADSINIGADAFGAGAESEIEFASDFVDFFNYIFAVIKNFFENLFA